MANHPHVLPVTEDKEHELGPALLFRYYDPSSIRFDHYLSTQCHKLTTTQRLKFLRDIADVIRYSHRKRVIHRSLSPYSILVMKDDGGRSEAERQLPPGTMTVRETSDFDDPAQLYLQVYNWQVGARLQTSVSAPVTQVEDFVESQALVYMSPEAIADPKRVSEASDIFSLGAIAFHLFTSRPPAGSLSELTSILRERKGLSVSAVKDGVGQKLEEFIQWSTHPDALTRIGNVEDFLSMLDEVEDELTAPDQSGIVDPLQELYDVAQPPPVPGCQPFSNERLINLAAAMSSEAAVSSRQELYPRNMRALRALRLGIGALSGLGLGENNDGFTIQQVHDRVSSRYPEAMALPTDPKELESMLQQVGIDVLWEVDNAVYRRREAKILVTSGSSIGSRRSTATSTRHVDSSSPETVEARHTEDRLQHAHRDGGFLVLTVKPSYLRPCERNLLHRFPDLERVSFDDLLFEQLRAKSVEYDFPWSDIYEADSEGPLDGKHRSEDWHNLLHLMSEVAPNIETELMNRAQPVLLVHPGLIARYQLMSVLQTLRDRVGPDSACPSLWVLVATDSQSEMPFLDGAQIPLISTGQRAAVSDYWIDNLHRGRGSNHETHETHEKIEGR